MRYLIFTDIHGNMEAFLAFLKFAQKRKVDHYLFLGDLVGYGASPNEIIQRIRLLKPISTIRGNHDKAVCGLDTVQTFNPIAASAIHWTRDHITKKNMSYLCKLKQGPMIVNKDIMICHGAPFDEDHYIFGEFDASEAFLHIPVQICFFGHTHFPFVYEEKDHIVEGTFLTGDDNEIKIEKGVRYLINPGSVGQPRDFDPRSSYGILDLEKQSFEYRRIPYDIESTQVNMEKFGLPQYLIDRLSFGR